MKKVALFAVISLMSSFATAQTKFGFELFSGGEVGWWIYNRGSDDASVFNNQGWDKTHYVVKLPVGFNVFVSNKYGNFGLGMKGSIMHEDVMLRQEDQPGARTRYPISTGWVGLLNYHIHVEPLLIKGNKVRISPSVDFGSFLLGTIHPEQERFGFKTSWAFGVTHEFFIGKQPVFIRPTYQVYNIKPKDEKFFNEKNTIYSIGILVGIRFYS